MKICFIAPANSAHIIKWCSWFHARGHRIDVISFTEGDIPGTEVHLIDAGVDTEGSDIGKLKYLFTGSKIKKTVSKIRPDVINVHYATSYGMAVALSGLQGYVLSVWGSDIYDFPNKSFFHKMLLKYSLKKAKKLFSTSHAMAEEASKYTNKEFAITPFGVDMELFRPSRRTRDNTDPAFIIGTVKTLAPLYGIDYILEAMAIIKKDYPWCPVKARIAGNGPQEQELKQRAKDLDIQEHVCFLGKIPQEQAAVEWANMDVAVIPSVAFESFGVAAVEAQASGTPVIISDVEGLKETTNPGKTSIIVPRKNAQAIAEAVIYLYQNPDVYQKMKIESRSYAVSKYELDNCFVNIENLLGQLSS